MAILQSKRQSDLEKRLQILRWQVYGKTEKANGSVSKQVNYQANKLVDNLSDSNTQFPNSATAHSEPGISYLRNDLFKILLLSSVAIGAQIILFFLLQNHILKLNFL